MPNYLSALYWSAYIHPEAVKLFERQWRVNFILWDNYVRLREAPLAELGESVPGRTLQVAWVYGDLTNCLIMFVKLEPFVLDLWREEITSWLSDPVRRSGYSSVDFINWWSR